jgi:hypothetical protein
MIKRRVWIRHPQGEEDLICPFFVCDACGLPIEDDGNVHYRFLEDAIQPTDDVWHSHNSRCCDDLEKRLGFHTMTHYISEELRMLQENLKTLPSDFAQQVRAE